MKKMKETELEMGQTEGKTRVEFSLDILPEFLPARSLVSILSLFCPYKRLKGWEFHLNVGKITRFKQQSWNIDTCIGQYATKTVSPAKLWLNDKDVVQ